METFYQRVSQTGLSIPPEIIRHFGFEQGDGVLIKIRRDAIRIMPAEADPEEIENRALRYLLRYVGDAVVIDSPQKEVNGNWMVPILAAETGEILGKLCFTPAGELMPGESTSLLDFLGVVSRSFVAL